MFKRFWHILFLCVPVLMVSSCGLEDLPPDDQLALLNQMQTLQRALHEGDYKEADSLIAQMADKNLGTECELAWARSLSGLLATVDRINGYIKLIPSSAPSGSWLPMALNGNALIREFLGPFEDEWLQIVSNGKIAMDQNCVFTVPGGVPFEMGTKGKLLYAEVVLGDDWTAPVARILVSTFTSLETIIDFAISHNLSLVDDITNEAMPFIKDVIEEQEDAERASVGTTTPVTYSYVSQIRPYGAIFDLAPDLIGFAKYADDRLRFEQIPAQLETIFTSIYDSTPEGETGIIPGLINADMSPAEASMAVLGFVDEDGNQLVSTGDRIVLGLRAFNLGSTLVLPSSPYGVEIYIPATLGRVDEMVAAMHDMVRILGDQAASIEDSTVSAERLGLDPVNRIIQANETLLENIGTLPEAVEIDIANYFGSDDDPARPLRDYLPYWYDDDNSAMTLDVFMIEGEARDLFDDSYVSLGDSNHFPDTITFGTIIDIPGDVITGLKIDADLVTAPSDFSQPIPYVGLQDPSFHEVLWVNPSVFSDVGSLYVPSFKPADQKTFNLVLNWYIRYALDQASRNSTLTLP